MELGREERDDDEDGGSEREADADISIMREDRETDIIIMAFIRIFPFSKREITFTDMEIQKQTSNQQHRHVTRSCLCFSLCIRSVCYK